MGLTENEATPAPLAAENLPKGGVVLGALFGNRSKGRNAAIDDSRQIGDLAKAFSDPDKVALLQDGHQLTDIIRRTKPLDEQLAEGLREAREILRQLVAELSEKELDSEVAEKLMPMSGGTRKLSVDLDKRIREIAADNDD